MKILLTGANGYIGKRLLPVLLENGHEVVATVRDKNRFDIHKYDTGLLETMEIDLLHVKESDAFPDDIDAAFYLIHSMGANRGGFSDLESQTAANFVELMDQTRAQQIVFLSGISNADHLSEHLKSRKKVENLLAASKVPLTTLRAGIIVGSGSASFEIIRDLVEKLPVMITPQWLKTKCQPIAIRNVIEYLYGVLHVSGTYNQTFDIGGPEILTYKQMLLKFAAFRKLKRLIITLPVMTPRLSSYWLYFVTSTSYNLAVNLVNSMKIEVVCKNDDIKNYVNIERIDYTHAIKQAFERIEQNLVLSSWKDAMIAGNRHLSLQSLIEVPTYGCFKDYKQIKITNDINNVIDNIWSIGGERGWYYGNFLWRIRGVLDKMAGGIGLRRGRTNFAMIEPGDVIDFWRVIYANRAEGRLLLYAEMKLPGEAWLAFNITKENHEFILQQTATFRPKGVWGRIYWFLLLPFHGFIFNGMIRNLERYK
ncbi:MAG: DUF2867 domain-containing protein [Bacteroidetes bacterium]|jgi:uncharacterized protein YbjT (DUF2867 family)|nr:DUF2867 domain-containing protein [Bacteroidota bacterium]